MEWEEVWAVYKPQIDKLSKTQWVPGLDADDVAQHMALCLWRAHTHYRPGLVSFGTFWWSVWKNHRDDLTAAYYAVKRVHGIPVDELPEDEESAEPAAEAEVLLFPMPPTTDPQGVAVWGGIASGNTPKEVTSANGISRRRYYEWIRRWRTPEVRDLLGPK